MDRLCNIITLHFLFCGKIQFTIRKMEAEEVEATRFKSQVFAFDVEWGIINPFVGIDAFTRQIFPCPAWH